MGEERQHYPISDVVTCMRISALMLRAADEGNSKINQLNCQQAELLSAAAKDLEAQFSALEPFPAESGA